MIKEGFDFSQLECKNLRNLSERLHKICEDAKEKSVKVMFDAEQTYY